MRAEQIERLKMETQITESALEKLESEIEEFEKEKEISAAIEKLKNQKIELI